MASPRLGQAGLWAWEPPKSHSLRHRPCAPPCQVSPPGPEGPTAPACRVLGPVWPRTARPSQAVSPAPGPPPGSLLLPFDLRQMNAGAGGGGVGPTPFQGPGVGLTRGPTHLGFAMPQGSDRPALLRGFRMFWSVALSLASGSHRSCECGEESCWLASGPMCLRPWLEGTHEGGLGLWASGPVHSAPERVPGLVLPTRVPSSNQSPVDCEAGEPCR